MSMKTETENEVRLVLIIKARMSQLVKEIVEAKDVIAKNENELQYVKVALEAIDRKNRKETDS